MENEFATIQISHTINIICIVIHVEMFVQHPVVHQLETHTRMDSTFELSAHFLLFYFNCSKTKSEFKTNKFSDQKKANSFQKCQLQLRSFFLCKNFFKNKLNMKFCNKNSFFYYILLICLFYDWTMVIVFFYFVFYIELINKIIIYYCLIVYLCWTLFL